MTTQTPDPTPDPTVVPAIPVAVPVEQAPAVDADKLDEAVERADLTPDEPEGRKRPRA